jgi:hypothetical protein
VSVPGISGSQAAIARNRDRIMQMSGKGFIFPLKWDSVMKDVDGNIGLVLFVK